MRRISCAYRRKRRPFYSSSLLLPPLCIQVKSVPIRPSRSKLLFNFFSFLSFLSDGFNTLRSVRSHVTEVSSVMTANVSEDAADGNGGFQHHPHHQHQHVAPVGQMSPPQPVSTLVQQHNYSNIQQPAPVMPSSSNANVMTSSQVRKRVTRLFAQKSLTNERRFSICSTTSAPPDLIRFRPASRRARTPPTPVRAAAPLHWPSPRRRRPRPPSRRTLPRWAPLAAAQSDRGLPRDISSKTIIRGRRSTRRGGIGWPRCKTSSTWSPRSRRTTS
jgi:hypothetical protein